MTKTTTERENFYRIILQSRDHNPTIPLQQFCAQHGISAWSYYHWRKRLHHTRSTPALSCPKSPTPFIPVRLTTPIATNRVEALLPNGVLVRFADGGGAQTLKVIAGLKWE